MRKVERQREAKKMINEELRARVDGNQQREREREDGRYDRMRAVREQREQLAMQNKQENEKIQAKRQVSQ